MRRALTDLICSLVTGAETKVSPTDVSLDDFDDSYLLTLRRNAGFFVNLFHQAAFHLRRVHAAGIAHQRLIPRAIVVQSDGLVAIKRFSHAQPLNQAYVRDLGLCSLWSPNARLSAEEADGMQLAATMIWLACRVAGFDPSCVSDADSPLVATGTLDMFIFKGMTADDLGNAIRNIHLFQPGSVTRAMLQLAECMEGSWSKGSTVRIVSTLLLMLHPNRTRRLTLEQASEQLFSSVAVHVQQAPVQKVLRAKLRTVSAQHRATNVSVILGHLRTFPAVSIHTVIMAISLSRFCHTGSDRLRGLKECADMAVALTCRDTGKLSQDTMANSIRIHHCMGSVWTALRHAAALRGALSTRPAVEKDLVAVVSDVYNRLVVAYAMWADFPVEAEETGRWLTDATEWIRHRLHRTAKPAGWPAELLAWSQDERVRSLVTKSCLSVLATLLAVEIQPSTSSAALFPEDPAPPCPVGVVSVLDEEEP